jgi:DNA (cytosine-5)-methyltransferase 1
MEKSAPRVQRMSGFRWTRWDKLIAWLLATIPSEEARRRMAGRSILVRDIPPQIRDWIARECAHRSLSQQELMLQVLEHASTGNGQLTLFDGNPRPAAPAPAAGMPFGFIDLFAGIGGLRLGLERVGGRCLFSSEWDRYCQKTYKAWFGEEPAGDITKIQSTDIPDHDLLAAGFPCQPFSIAGVSKKNSLGRAHGFHDATQGNLFFNLATIIQIKRPPAILLENVKNLQSHDKGRTWDVIRSTLENLEYRLFTQIIDAASWVPQHRERIFIVGFDKRVFGQNPPFAFPAPPPGEPPKLRSILEPTPDQKYTLSNHLWRYLQDYAERHRERGNGFGFGLADLDGVTRTLSARYYKDGSEILIPQPRKAPRRLTIRETARIMGFPDSLPIVVSDTQAYKQFGNAVVPAVASAVATQIVKVLEWHFTQTRGGCLLKSQAPGTAAEQKRVANGVAGM